MRIALASISHFAPWRGRLANVTTRLQAPTRARKPHSHEVSSGRKARTQGGGALTKRTGQPTLESSNGKIIMNAFGSPLMDYTSLHKHTTTLVGNQVHTHIDRSSEKVACTFQYHQQGRVVGFWWRALSSEICSFCFVSFGALGRTDGRRDVGNRLNVANEGNSCVHSSEKGSRENVKESFGISKDTLRMLSQMRSKPKSREYTNTLLLVKNSKKKSLYF